MPHICMSVCPWVALAAMVFVTGVGSLATMSLDENTGSVRVAEGFMMNGCPAATALVRLNDNRGAPSSARPADDRRSTTAP